MWPEHDVNVLQHTIRMMFVCLDILKAAHKDSQSTEDRQCDDTTTNNLDSMCAKLESSHFSDTAVNKVQIVTKFIFQGFN